MIRSISFLLIFFLTTFAHAEFLYRSFDESMHATETLQHKPEYILLKKIYENNNPKALGNKTRNAIPKIIHQIWLGPRTIPEQHLKNSQKWQELHPNWEYKLWREVDIENWSFESKDLFNKASSYQEKADILRYEILNKHGGLYVDMDYRPLKNFDEIHEKYIFYGSLEPTGQANPNLTIANSIIASSPNNIILHKTLKEIRDHWESVEISFRQEAKNITKEKNLVHLAVNRTMMPFNRAILNNISDSNGIIIFPTSYMSIEERDNILDKPKIFFGFVSDKLYFRIPKQETMAVQKRGKRIITDLANIGIKNPWYYTSEIKKTLSSLFRSDNTQ